MMIYWKQFVCIFLHTVLWKHTTNLWKKILYESDHHHHHHRTVIHMFMHNNIVVRHHATLEKFVKYLFFFFFFMILLFVTLLFCLMSHFCIIFDKFSYRILLLCIHYFIFFISWYNILNVDGLFVILAEILFLYPLSKYMGVLVHTWKLYFFV